MNRTLLSFLLLSIPTLLQAQIINGSFEQAGAASLAGWEWTCEDPGQVNEAPPGAGSWHATKEASQAKGCFANYLYQRLSGVQDGDMLSISGWVRCDDDVNCLGANFGLGTINTGYIFLEETVGSNQWTWQYLTISDTVELAPGDTSILVLNAGFIGGPFAPAPGHFDGFSVEHVLSVGDENGPLLVHYREGTNFYVASSSARILGLRLLDLTGRAITDYIERNMNTYRISLEGLGTGVYFAAVRTDRGDKAIRFVVE